MVRECAGLPGASDPRVTAERVDIASEPEYRRVSANGWAMDSAPLLPYHAALLSDPAQRTQLFLARFDAEPAATGSASSHGRSSHLVGGVVLPAFRGRGLYRALVHARLAAAKEAGCELATTHAGSMSGPLLERLGFVTVCTFPTFLYAPG
jgi:GNAT superfamily N-acetyltransferase